MKLIKTKFKNLILIKSKNHKDSRGYLREIYLNKILKKKFIFDYYSSSKKNTVRGLHFQIKEQQEKLITVIKGEILDVCLDLRKDSKTFLKIFKVVLSSKNSTSIFIPKGFAHGFIALGRENIVLYKNTKYRKKNLECGIDIFDKQLYLNIDKTKSIVSKKDKNNIPINSFLKKYKTL